MTYRKKSKPKTDNYQMVTDAIVAALEDGTAPWVKPWDAGRANPHNGDSKHTYQGINVWLTWIAMQKNGWTDPRFYTFKQAKKLNGFNKKGKGWEHESGERPEGGPYGVMKGSKGTKITFWKFLDQEVKDMDGNVVLDPEGNPKMRRRPMLRLFTVFNHQQINWLEGKEPKTGGQHNDINPETACADACALLEAVGAKVSLGGSEASYSPSGDDICLPKPESFNSAEDFVSTSFHEHAHWTGAKGRCDRKLDGNRFGEELYAMEELVAELTSAFLCSEFGVQGRLQHAEYIANWLKVLKGDKYAIFTAAREGRKAAEFIKGLAAGRKPAAPKDDPSDSEMFHQAA